MANILIGRDWRSDGFGKIKLEGFSEDNKSELAVRLEGFLELLRA